MMIVKVCVPLRAGDTETVGDVDVLFVSDTESAAITYFRYTKGYTNLRTKRWRVNKTGVFYGSIQSAIRAVMVA